MSHTTVGSKCRFHHNGTFEGNVTISHNDKGVALADVPFADIKMLVATWIRSERIAAIEGASDDEMLFGVIDHRIALT